MVQTARKTTDMQEGMEEDNGQAERHKTSRKVKKIGNPCNLSRDSLLIIEVSEIDTAGSNPDN